KGTVGHHVKALEDSGLIRVVRARKVRAVVEKFYGRVAKTFVFPSIPGVEEQGIPPFIAEAIDEAREPNEGEASLLTLRHARIPHHLAHEFQARLMALGEEFAGSSPGGSTTYGMLLGLYTTDRPSLPDGDIYDEGTG
ncbi:ArsR family transcriptional regulator, partial [bacterium]|nr:ArsR family transcriptional regulator [bacterium]